jgi:uncharacterized SAM-binding protein YcdF (DUF218 family)
MFFWLKAVARAFILPPGCSLILILAGMLLVWRRTRLGWWVFLLGFGTLWLMCTPFVSDRLLQLAERYPAFDPSKPTNAQAIVVIGGGGERVWAAEYKGPVAEQVLLERLALAAYLARTLSLPVLTSGAPDEALAMAATLKRNLGISPRWIESNSRDTFENARLSARILLPLGVRRIILVTSSTHEWRAAHEFMDAGFEVTPAPSGVLSPRETGVFMFVPGPMALSRSNAAIYELIGEPMRQLQKALGVRERLDPRIQPEVR